MAEMSSCSMSRYGEQVKFGSEVARGVVLSEVVVKKVVVEERVVEERVVEDGEREAR